MVRTKTRTCTITKAPMSKEEFCKTEKQCDRDKLTCAEAHYRLTVCKHAWLDGGTARGTYDKPNQKGEPDGIPCENVCGSDARAMVKSLWAERPFSLPPTTAEKCVTN